VKSAPVDRPSERLSLPGYRGSPLLTSVIPFEFC